MLKILAVVAAVVGVAGVANAYEQVVYPNAEACAAQGKNAQVFYSVHWDHGVKVGEKGYVCVEKFGRQ